MRAIENGNQLAFPTNSSLPGNFGLTKREWFAGMALIGISSTSMEQFKEDAMMAIGIADAILEELANDSDTINTDD